MRISAKPEAVLQAISEGHAYDQIIREGMVDSYLEIFGAATEALAAMAGYPERIPSPGTVTAEQFQPEAVAGASEIDRLHKQTKRGKRGKAKRAVASHDERVRAVVERFKEMGAKSVEVTETKIELDLPRNKVKEPTKPAPSDPATPPSQPTTPTARSEYRLTSCWGPGCGGLVENRAGAHCPKCGRTAF